MCKTVTNRPTLNDVDFDLWGLQEEVGSCVAGVEAAVLRPRALQDQRADGRRRLVGQHANSAASRCVVDRLKSSRILIFRPSQFWPQSNTLCTLKPSNHAQPTSGPANRNQSAHSAARRTRSPRFGNGRTNFPTGKPLICPTPRRSSNARAPSTRPHPQVTSKRGKIRTPCEPPSCIGKAFKSKLFPCGSFSILQQE